MYENKQMDPNTLVASLTKKIRAINEVHMQQQFKYSMR